MHLPQIDQIIYTVGKGLKPVSLYNKKYCNGPKPYLDILERLTIQVVERELNIERHGMRDRDGRDYRWEESNKWWDHYIHPLSADIRKCECIIFFFFLFLFSPSVFHIQNGTLGEVTSTGNKWWGQHNRLQWLSSIANDQVDVNFNGKDIHRTHQQFNFRSKTKLSKYSISIPQLRISYRRAR